MAAGALLAMLYQVLLIRFKIGFWVFDKAVGLITLSLIPLLIPSFVKWSFTGKLMLSIVCYLLFLFVSVQFKIVNKQKVLDRLPFFRPVKTI